MIQHVEATPTCPFCDLGDLSSSDLQIHVNSAHLDGVQCLEGNIEAAGGVPDSPVVNERSEALSLTKNPFLDDSDTEEESPIDSSPKRIKTSQPTVPCTGPLLKCPLCPHSERNVDSLERHVNT